MAVVMIVYYVLQFYRYPISKPFKAIVEKDLCLEDFPNLSVDPGDSYKHKVIGKLTQYLFF